RYFRAGAKPHSGRRSLPANNLPRENTLPFEVVQQQRGGILRGRSGGVDRQLGLLGRFVGVVDAGEVFQLAGAGLFVQALGVALLAGLDGRGDVDFAEGEVALVVDGADGFAVLAVGADEAGHGDQAGVGEQFGDLADAADVLFAVGGREAEVLVQSVP